MDDDGGKRRQGGAAVNIPPRQSNPSENSESFGSEENGRNNPASKTPQEHDPPGGDMTKTDQASFTTKRGSKTKRTRKQKVWTGPWDRTNRYFFPTCGHKKCIIRARLRRKVHKEHAKTK